MSNFRTDVFKIDGQREKTAEGFTRTRAVATRSGVFRYLNADGSSRYEYRSDAEVSSLDSLNTLRMVPLTNNHPAEGLVTPGNAKQVSVGFTGQDVRFNRPYVEVSVTITDETAISDVDSGKVELSCGYFCDCHEQAGTYEGQAFTHVQKNIRYNHLSLVAKGRAGENCRVDEDQFNQDYDPLAISNDLDSGYSGRTVENEPHQDSQFSGADFDLMEIW